MAKSKKKPETVDLVLAVKVKAPKGMLNEEVARLVQMMVDVGQADAAESADDRDIDNPDAGAANSLEVTVAPEQYVVIGTIDDKFPEVRQIEQFTDKKLALDLAVTLAKEQGATEADDQIRKELDDEGYYVPTKYAEWAVTLATL